MTRPALLMLLPLLLAAAEPQTLKQVQTIELPGVEGRFDHFAVDEAGGRLFVAALGNNTLEVIDTRAGRRIHTIKGLHKPTGVAFVPKSNWIVVAGGDDGTCRFYDGETFKLVAQVKGLDDADNVRYDPAAGRIYCGYGDGGLFVINAANAVQLAAIKLDAHPESFQLEHEGNRIFLNVPDAPGAPHIAVIDRGKQAVIGKWSLPFGVSANFPMALDETHHRLFVGCRKPAKVVVFDTETGKPVGSIDCVADTDDVFYDASKQRIYVSGGAGAVTVIQQRDADHYDAVGDIPTADGARTSFFVQSTGRLYVAVPHRGSQHAELRVFERTP